MTTSTIPLRDHERDRYRLVSRWGDALVAPSHLFAQLRPRAPWLDVLVLASLLHALCTWMLWTSDVGQSISTAQHHAILRSVEQRLTDQQFQQVRERLERGRVTPTRRAVQAGVQPFIFTLVIAGCCHLALTTLFLRRDLTYRHYLSLVSHAAPAWLVGKMLLLLLTYVTGSLYVSGSVPQLLPFMPVPTDHTLLGATLNDFDILNLWPLLILAVGLADTFRVRCWMFAVPLCAGTLLLALAQATFDVHDTSERPAHLRLH